MHLPKPLIVMTPKLKHDDTSHLSPEKGPSPGQRMSSSGFSNLTISTCDSDTELESSCSSLDIFDKLTSFFHRKRSSKSCSCPHVLIADDDPFQHFCYQTLFQKSLEFNDIADIKEDLHMKLCFSGEELINRFKKIALCGCNRPLLVIVDYFMGNYKLNGIQAVFKIRAAGYTGPIVLRTSETEEYLNARHIDFYFLFKTNVITEMVAKDNLKHIKEIIQGYVQKR